MVMSVLAFFPHSAVEYLQDVSGVGGCKHLNVTCTFASSIDITLQCSVDLAGPTAKSVKILKETSSTTAVVMVSFKCGVCVQRIHEKYTVFTLYIVFSACVT